MASSSNVTGDGEVEAIVGRVYGAVRRSMCPYHFTDFKSLYENLNGFARFVAETEPNFKDQILTFFPHSPQKIDRDAWVAFEAWLITNDGQRVIDFCLNWGFYGRYVFRVCEDCLNLVNPPVVEVHVDNNGPLVEENPIEVAEEVALVENDDVVEGEVPDYLEFIPMLKDWIEGQIFRAVERSFCDMHFHNFHNFHDDLDEFSQMLALSTTKVVEQAFTPFL